MKVVAEVLFWEALKTNGKIFFERNSWQAESISLRYLA